MHLKASKVTQITWVGMPPDPSYKPCILQNPSLPPQKEILYDTLVVITIHPFVHDLFTCAFLYFVILYMHMVFIHMCTVFLVSQSHSALRLYTAYVIHVM